LSPIKVSVFLHMIFQIKEIVRIIATVVLVSILMFLVQPNLYSGGVIPISEDVATWVPEKYVTSTVIVLLSAVLPLGLWALLTVRAKATPRDMGGWTLLWWVLLLIPILGVCAGIYLACDASREGTSQDALLSLSGLFVLDILLLFWLPTAMNTPGNLRYGAVPFSLLVRKLIGE
jgi:hypothetical protein